MVILHLSSSVSSNSNLSARWLRSFFSCQRRLFSSFLDSRVFLSVFAGSELNEGDWVEVRSPDSPSSGAGCWLCSSDGSSMVGCDSTRGKFELSIGDAFCESRERMAFKDLAHATG